jgi:uncharacterized protein with PIN domain
MTPFRVQLTFHGDLPFFLKSKSPRIERTVSERTSVKDVIEACGVPHTEVDLILADDQAVDFRHVLGSPVEVHIFPVERNGITSFPENLLQMREIRNFVADGHLGKLVRDLRLLGINVAYDRDAEDRQLIGIATAENRALLTRDRRLLMHAVVQHGHYLRSQNPLEQTLAVIRRFDLTSGLAPFSRCLRCNAPLQPAPKEKVLGELEPLTKIYYHEFRRCGGCRQIYWSGSHFEKLQRRIETIWSRLGGEA